MADEAPPQNERRPNIFKRLSKKKISVFATAIALVLLLVLLTAVILVTRSKTRYVCEKDPPGFKFLHSDWDGKTRARGTIVNYRCGYVNTTAVARKVQCRNSGLWVDNYIQLENCKLDEISIKKFKEEEKNLISTINAGCVMRNPPPAGKYFRDWNELKWKKGTVIKYYCSEDENSPLAKIVECSANLTWTTTEVIDETCECPKEPPEYGEKKDLLDWDSKQLWIGTIIGYRCSTEYGAQYEKLYICGTDKQWKIYKEFSCNQQ